MATAGYKARIYNGEQALAAKLSMITIGTTVDMLDPTTFADGSRRARPGLDTSTLSCDGFIDADALADNAAWTAAQPFSYGHKGSAHGDPAILVNALKGSFETGTQVAGLATFTIAGQTDGATDFGVFLHDNTAETADASSASHDGGAASANGGVGHLHVSAYDSLTDATVTIEDSSTGSSGWAAIATFATVTGTTSERVEITGAVKRYLRATVDVTDTGSISFAVAFARR